MSAPSSAEAIAKRQQVAAAFGLETMYPGYPACDIGLIDGRGIVNVYCGIADDGKLRQKRVSELGIFDRVEVADHRYVYVKSTHIYEARGLPMYRFNGMWFSPNQHLMSVAGGYAPAREVFAGTITTVPYPDVHAYHVQVESGNTIVVNGLVVYLPTF